MNEPNDMRDNAEDEDDHDELLDAYRNMPDEGEVTFEIKGRRRIGADEEPEAWDEDSDEEDDCDEDDCDGDDE